MLSCITKSLRNQTDYLTDLRRFWPPDAESGQEKRINKSEEGGGTIITIAHDHTKKITPKTQARKLFFPTLEPLLGYSLIFKLERKIPQQLELVAVCWLVDRAFYLAQLLVLVFIRCQQINASMDKRLTQAAKIVALTLKLGLIRQPWQTVRYMVKHRRKSSLCMLSVSNKRFVGVVNLMNKSQFRTFSFSGSAFART
ncbi:hypothetical protein T11_8581 [Trichinella zimbabwensis]|uniref:Uncharacterized protein n=1 Tax=Trichinella zimbabwensis TaxID=268475 RepID=A0A0V1HLC7_9BILA|nr:hypothetical protein T11_8581 [Trichinella zimbabwensis]